ncbi:MAG: hypothetical protein NDP22_03900 [Crenarchaeota archaeon]|nr:hypothetical protein [Thermoproteota archaeon]
MKSRGGQSQTLDPLAGFGLIRLEALRLSVSEIVATEFLPAAYIPESSPRKYLNEQPTKDLKEFISNIEPEGE